MARRSDAEIVFGLARPIAAHTAVTLGGPAGPAVSGLATGTGAAVTLRPTHAAWLFYDDRGPFQAYEHPGRVALVDTVTGRVTMSGTMLWPPVVGGALPPFLHSANAYAAASGHVFYRPYRGAARLAAAAHAADGVRAAFDPTQARRAGAVLAAEHACVISFGDTLGGGYYDLTRIVQSRGALAGRVAQLSRAARGVRSVTYAARGRVTPASLARSEVSAHGCREVLLYAAGSGYERGAAINIGMQLGRSTVRHQDVTVAALRSLIRAERRVTFLLVLDAPSAAGFQQLVRLPNVRLVATPAGGLSFTYLPEAIVGGTLQANDRNSAKLLALTYRLVAGLDQVIDDPCEVSQATALQHAGKSGFAYLLARALARGGTADWVTRASVGAAPTVRTTGFSAAAPICLPADAVTATNDAYTAHNDATFGVPGARGLLVNDSDTQHRAITLDQLDGNGGPLPLHGTSAKGAAVVVHADGAFSYDARGVAAIQALPRGQTTSDTFSYRITDGLGATDSATVTMTVLGTRNHSPVTQGDTATISSTVPLHGANVLSNDSDPDGDTLDGHAAERNLGAHAARARDGAAVTIDPHGSFTYDPTGSTTLKALPDGGHMTDSFTYTVDDGHGGTSSATVSITVTGVNDPPVAVNDGSTETPIASTTSDTPLTSQPTLFVNDSDPDTGDTFTLNSASVTSAKGAVGDGQQRRYVDVRPESNSLTLRALHARNVNHGHVHLHRQRRARVRSATPRPSPSASPGSTTRRS